MQYISAGICIMWRDSPVIFVVSFFFCSWSGFSETTFTLLGVLPEVSWLEWPSDPVDDPSWLLTLWVTLQSLWHHCHTNWFCQQHYCLMFDIFYTVALLSCIDCNHVRNIIFLSQPLLSYNLGWKVNLVMLKSEQYF